MRTQYKKHILQFKVPSGTSRGVLRNKYSWFLMLTDNSGNIGVGECSVIEGLNPESLSDVEGYIEKICNKINEGELISREWFGNKPSVLFAYEMAMMDIERGGQRRLFDCPLLHGSPIPINGLVWMGELPYMRQQIIEKIQSGYRCIKLKIAAIDFQEELELIKGIRREFSEDDIEIRVDANGGFTVDEALDRLEHLSQYGLHSIEQPIKANQWEEMARLVEHSPLPIALDEELIGIKTYADKKQLLQIINPEYIILKPSLVGGFAESKEWINLANDQKIGWWITSALESNVGLSAIAQWTSTLRSDMYQGLGTGQLFTNNIPCPLYIHNGHLHHGDDLWDLDLLND